MKKTFTIIRVSRQDQLKGYGPNVQWFDDVLPNAQILDLEVSEQLKRVIQESATGWDRDKFQEAVREALDLYRRGEVEALLFPRVDRETRFLFGSFPLLCEVIKAGMKVYFGRERFQLDPNDSESVDRYLRKAQEANAYIEAMRVNTMGGKLRRAKEDHMMPTGSSKFAHDYHPYQKKGGYPRNLDSGRYTVNAEKAALVKSWADWILLEGMSINKLSKFMRDKKGIEISRSTIAAILSDPILIGKVYAYKTKVTIDAKSKHKKINIPESEWLLVYEDPALRILSDEQFYVLKEKFRQNKANAVRNAKNWYPPLRSLVFCTCGRRMVGIILGGKQHGIPYYRCLACGRYEKAIPLWEEIKAGIKQRLLDPESLVSAIRAQIASGQSISRLEEEIKANQEELDNLDQASQKALRLHLRLPKYSIEILEVEEKRIDESRKALARDQGRLKRQVEELKQAMVDEARLLRFCEIATRNLDGLKDEQWRVLLETMKVKILVNDTGITVKMAVPSAKAETSVIAADTSRSSGR